MASYRNDFPMLSKTMHGKPLVYLDSAATAQKPQVVIDAIARFYQEQYGTVHRAVYDLAVFATDQYQKVRKAAQKFLCAAKPEEIIFTRGTTESINLIAYSFGKAFLKPKDEILITEMEHHSNIVPWQIACEDRGAQLKVVPFDQKGVLDLEAFRKLLTPRTKLVAITHVSNALGTVNPIREIVQMAHAAQAKVLIDGAQAAPHRPVDVQALDADFYVFSGHKTYGPTGIGVLYGKEALLEAMPPYQGGGDMIETVTFPKTTYNVLPLKFEAGTPMIAEVIGLGAALEYLEKVGRDAVLDWEQKLLAYATPRLLDLKGVTLYGQAPEKGGILSFTLDGIHPLDIGTMLDLKGIAIRTGHHCAQPVMRHFGITATARASFALYTSFEDIDRWIQGLREIQELFRP
jgi:cysteine desulfurase/selenocysteine lyase